MSKQGPRGRFEGKVALVTGAASGIGLATARRLLSEGARVLMADVATPPDPLDPDCARFVHCDVACAQATLEAVNNAVEHFGGLDVLVNAAGVPHVARIPETTEADWCRVIDVNLKGVFLMCRAALPQLRGRAGANIVNIASELGVVGHGLYGAYCASKGGVIQLTRAMAIDHGAEGIRVNAVCPGPIDTPMLASFLQAEPDAGAATSEATASTLLGRFGTAEEIAATVAFVASEEASYMTGASVLVDGGVTAQ